LVLPCAGFSGRFGLTAGPRRNVSIEGVDGDTKRSFNEAYSSTPEPPIPVWITYHWIVFRAKSPTAKITVSDWSPAQEAASPFGQEQTFNFLELQPYHE
jgi:hypothetical protein